MQTTGAGRRSASAVRLLPISTLEHLDELLRPHARAIGPDFMAYRHHVCRVTAFCSALARPTPNASERIAIAAAYHDIGIWTHGTFDYLQPSIDDCSAYLESTGRSAWTPEITTMIREHHKVTPWRSNGEWLVEPFRRADLVDLSRGLLSHGLPRRFLSSVFAEWPSLGFRWRLVQLTLARFRRHPLSPLPMLRL